MEKEKIKKEMTIKEVLQKHPQTFPLFIDYGLYCVGCSIAQFETIEEMTKAYGFDLEKFLADLNKKIEKE